MNLIDYSSSVWSVVPALLALVLAIATRKVIISLSVGIVVGALLLTDGKILDSLSYLKNTAVSLFYKGAEEGLNSNNINIIRGINSIIKCFRGKSSFCELGSSAN